LRHSARTPDELVCKVRFPDGAVHDYRTKVIKAQKYGNDELFEKRLLLLTPFYLMRYERELSRIERGIEQGTVQGARDLAGILGAQGVDPELLRSALGQLGIPQE
jgi:hypothetical protein